MTEITHSVKFKVKKIKYILCEGMVAPLNPLFKYPTNIKYLIAIQRKKAQLFRGYSEKI